MTIKKIEVWGQLCACIIMYIKCCIYITLSKNEEVPDIGLHL